MDEKTINIWNDLNEQLFNFVNKKVQNSEAAKDIVQDVFLKVNTKIGTLKNHDKIIPWIFQITRNEISNHFRSQKLEEGLDNLSLEEQEIEDLTPEFSQCLLPMINTLPDKYKEALTLSEIENMSQKRMAERLDISYSGAKSRVQRGRDLLKSSLLQCCEISVDKYGNVLSYHMRNCDDRCE